MKILIVYFSGTGNTAKIADLYGKEFTDAGSEVTVMRLPQAADEIKGVNLADFDLLGFGYPIHSFNAPQNFLEFAKSLPKLSEGKRAFIFKTSGEPVRMSDVSSLKLIKILKRRNIRVTNEYQYVMPYNIIFRHSDDMAYKMWTTAKRLVPVDCREISSGTPCRPKSMFMGSFLAWFLRIEHPGARIIGIGFKTTKKCVDCGLCVKNCPANNIKVNKKGKIKFGGKCLICMRCVFKCPRDAIKPGLLNGWRVNGDYSFTQPTQPHIPNKHDKYCKKAYDRYFENAEQKLRQDNQTQTSEE